MSLATSPGVPPLQVGAVLLLDVGAGLDPPHLVEAIGSRLTAVPRLRQRLVNAPATCGRPYWVDDPDFRIADHVTVLDDAETRDEEAVLTLASDLLRTPLTRAGPLWAAVLVTRVTHGRAALVVVFHHVVGDGGAGLTVLLGLVDGAAPAVDAGSPRAAPTRRVLALDAARGRASSVRHLLEAVRRLASGAAELVPAVRSHAVPCSLNSPSGPSRRFVVVATDEAALRELAHHHDATVNDLVLAAVTGSLGRLLAERGEDVAELVVSIPFSSRGREAGGDLGNQSGVIPVRLPTGGSPPRRVVAVSRVMRAAKGSPRGASTALLAPLSRVLVTLGLYRYAIDHQRSIHTFVSSIRGPGAPLRLSEHPITGLIPLSVATGNVTVGFTVLSYAGRLVVTVNADPVACPDLDRLRCLLESDLVTGTPVRDLPRQPGRGPVRTTVTS